jgi:hypothetical protein
MLRLSLFVIFYFVVVLTSLLRAQTTLDNFSDNNLSANPEWTVASGSPSAATGALVLGGGATAVSLSTPLTVDCQAWSFSLRSSSSSNNDNVRFYFVLVNNASPSNASADGYCVDYDGNNGDFILYRLDNGAVTKIGSTFDKTPSNGTSARTVSITMNSSGNISVTVSGETGSLTATDNTYPAITSEFIAITCDTGDGDSDTYTMDNITYTAACSNPTAAGSIGIAQISCGSFNPAAISSLSLPSGHTGTLEYKWQSSITSSSSGFADIASSNSSTYDPPLITQTTWYRRLARVSCSADWSGAVTSNVIEMSVRSALSFTGNPVADTVFNQSGNASFGVTTNSTAGVTYQWQVSTNGGGSWANLSNGGFYSGVTSTTLQVINPTFAMDSYLYRSVATNTCGSVNSVGARLSVLPITSFSNTTSTACGTNMNNDFSFQRTVTVSGLPSTLGTSSGQYVLKQVNLQLGTSACKGNLSSYRARLISPAGTTIELFNTFTTSLGSMWTNIKYRDHVSLERVNQYVDNDQLNYHPHSIGYYAVQTDGSFFSVNGQNPNGNWRLEISENVTTGNEVSFQRVELIFGPNFSITDISASSANDNCATPQCIGTQSIVVGTNNGYSVSEPASSFVGTTADGCGWNGANNNSAWFNFVASATSSYITMSGIANPTPGGNDTQSIIFSRTGDCSSMGTINVPTGGCLDDVGDATSVNLMDYLTPDGGIASINNLYNNGISANVEFKLSGLTVGQTYYMYIDGNGGVSSSFYIEALSGCETCNTPLPIELAYFDAQMIDKVTHLSWQTASERNNDYFSIERSANGIDWIVLETMKGVGFSDRFISYETFDLRPLRGISYYRLKQTDFDGKSSYSQIRTISNMNELIILPNPGSGIFYISGLSDSRENSIVVRDITGKEITSITTQGQMQQLNLSQYPGGVYLVTINAEETIRLIKATE